MLSRKKKICILEKSLFLSFYLHYDTNFIFVSLNIKFSTSEKTNNKILLQMDLEL